MPPHCNECLNEAKNASEKFAKEGNVDVSWERIWNIEPILFNNELIEMADAAIGETGAKPIVFLRVLCMMPPKCALGRSGRYDVCAKLHGISHNKIEDTKEEHLELAVTAFDKLASKAMDWIG